ncbi:hypothetical protein [Ancylomarina longa]|uniref:Uncharacterized protein n=1 Tax=Ancylomarina longa TaxID=2487017 RepID=A0A434AYJ9_9BACT|nr:hypothetical protein [Ancylomarina longa]RUT79643.1 hypothetical protein DLK05_02855 [Ancylomarina longa]
MKEIEKIELNEWLSELKAYQRNSIEALIESYGEEEAAEKWITSNGPSNNVPFGGESNRDTKPFFERFKVEFGKFICGHPDYEEYRKKLGAESPIIKSTYIAIISAALGATLGFTATLLAPAVAILLASVGKMGLNAYCQGLEI